MIIIMANPGDIQSVMQNIPTMEYSRQQQLRQQTGYRVPTPLLSAIDWLLSTPSIPLAMRQQFYVLWESVVFGNYERRDILLLMSKFREWCILIKWFIPEQNWGNIYEFKGDTGKEKVARMDLNILLNTLYQLYFVNLTRGKDGFTTKELTTTRSIYGGGFTTPGQDSKRKTIRLF